MSKPAKGTMVICRKCSNTWETRAKKKAICSKCGSQQVNIVATGEKYNAQSEFISRQKGKAPTKKRKEDPIAEIMGDPSEDEMVKLLMDDIPEEPAEFSKEQVMKIFGGYPDPPKNLIDMVQGFSAPLAHSLGDDWLMEDWEAKLIAKGLMPILAQYSGALDKLDPRYMALFAIGLYLAPRVVPMIFGWLKSTFKREEPEEEGWNDVPVPTPDLPPIDPSRSEIKNFERSSKHYAEDKYGGVFDEHGSDRFGSRRTVGKPGTA